MADTEPFLFVSHVSEDRAAAMRIVTELERRRVKCWIAPRNIEPGRPFDDAIASALEHCAAMLLVFSDQCNESEYIRREVTVAGENQKVIIPFRIDDAQPRRGLRVRLSDLHWLDGLKSREESIDELARLFALVETDEAGHHAVTVTPTPAVPAAPVEVTAGQPPFPASPTAAKKSSLPMLGGGVAIAVVAIGAALWFWAGRPAPAPEVDAAGALAKGTLAFQQHDLAEAVRWDREAAEQGNAIAQTYLGYFYEQGLGVTRDYTTALQWYRKAADQGHGPALKDIGNLYEQGLGVAQDYAEAMRWYRQAAERGNAGAQTNIGYLYEKGLGVPQSYADALSWYRKAADLGDASAENNIGVFFDKGLGVPQDDAEAMRWYRMAADKGDTDGEYNLALLYAAGRGVPADLEQARQWMQKAAAKGDTQSQKWLREHGG